MLGRCTEAFDLSILALKEWKSEKKAIEAEGLSVLEPLAT